MFFINQHRAQKEAYSQHLQTLGSLSKLFSDSLTPYLYYRLAEKVFCSAFDAEDLSRSDVAIDAKKDGIGIGLKTFLIGNKKSFQKVAEFNADRYLYENLPVLKKIKKIAQLRNERIEFAKRTFALHSSIYHCVVRDKARFYLFEEPMDLIDIGNITIRKASQSSILFTDNIHEYSFSLSKSTLLKKFVTDRFLSQITVEILQDPLPEIQKIVSDTVPASSEEKYLETIYLPLYGENKKVYPNSGLNQWNAAGRKRNSDEAYIPVPAFIHKRFPRFFPDRKTKFYLTLPNGEILSAKICQGGGKALMSNPNQALGSWILRTVLQLPKGELVTDSKLAEMGVDSVRVDKLEENVFEINFTSTNTFEEWKENLNLPQ